MRKLILSTVVVSAFLFYGLAKQEGLSQSDLFPKHQISITPINTATASPSPTPLQSSTATTPPSTSSSHYKDGTYTGTTEDAFYGNVQVQITISQGKITDVQFLQYPNDRTTSIMINSQAMPYLKQEAIQSQSAQVDTVSGATDTSQAFQLSLSSAINQAL